ncbi:hypothetical protein AOLI_G00273980 [Acnodon oligacanthus]
MEKIQTRLVSDSKIILAQAAECNCSTIYREAEEKRADRKPVLVVLVSDPCWRDCALKLMQLSFQMILSCWNPTTAVQNEGSENNKPALDSPVAEVPVLEPLL